MQPTSVLPAPADEPAPTSSPRRDRRRAPAVATAGEAPFARAFTPAPDEVADDSDERRDEPHDIPARSRSPVDQRAALLAAAPPASAGLRLASGVVRPDSIEFELLGNLLDRMLYFSLRGLEAHARSLAARWEHEPWHAARATLVATVVRSRSGDTAGARAEQEALLSRVSAWPELAARTQVELGATLERLGERSAATKLIGEALEHWPEGIRPGWRAECLMVLVCGMLSRASVDRELVRRAVSEVREHCDRLLLPVTLANFAELFAECGDLPASVELADEADAVLERHPDLIVPLTLDSIARSRLAVGELARAEFCLTKALALERELGCTDVNGDPWLTFAELRLAQGQPDDALRLLDDPRRAAWAARTAWAACRDLKLRSSILAAQRRWEQAYRTLAKHAATYEELRSIEDDRVVAEVEGRQAAAHERRRAARFEALAMSDPLTALPNRRAVDLWLATETGACRGPIGVAIIDLDLFKTINDRFGHEVGDRVLQRVAEQLRRFAVRPGRSAGRLGGEEFVVLDAVPDDDLVSHVDAILHAIRRLDLSDLAPGLRLTASAGVAVSADGTGVADLLRSADEQLYEAKNAGRDRLSAVTR